MALAFGAIILNGVRCKIFTVTFLDGDPPADLAVGLVASGMTDLPAAPTEIQLTQTGGADTGVQLAVTAIAATGITVRKILDPGVGAVACTVRVTLRVPRGIAG